MGTFRHLGKSGFVFGLTIFYILSSPEAVFIRAETGPTVPLQTKIIQKGDFQSMPYIGNTYKKIMAQVTECLTYTIDFCLGRGYKEFVCWECQTNISLAKRKRFVKCPQCRCWNIHPIWGQQGENIKSFSKKLYVSNLLFLFLLVSYGLGINWLSKLFY